MLTFITSNDPLFYVCTKLTCICLLVFVTRESIYLVISPFLYFCTFIPIYSGSFSLFLLFIVFLVMESSVAKSVSYATFEIFSTASEIYLLHLSAIATSSTHKRHCSVVLNIVPPKFVFTFLINFSV